MRRVIGHYLPPEMALLGLIETVFSFVAIYILLTIAHGSASFAISHGLSPHADAAVAAFPTLVALTVGLVVGLYRADVFLNGKRLLIGATLVAGVAFAILLGMSGGTTSMLSFHTALFIAEALAAWLLVLASVRLIYAAAARPALQGRRVLILGDGRERAVLGRRLRSCSGVKFEPVERSSELMSCDMLRASRIWSVVLASEPHSSTVALLLDCKLRGIKVLGSSAFCETYLGRIDLNSLTETNFVMQEGFQAGRLDTVLKRTFDVVVASVMLLLAMPLMLLTAIAIKLDSPGSVLYSQTRAGQFEKPFTLMKFRSMSADAEAGGKPCWAQQNDPRVTRVGSFIRATRIDELPQLLNVLRGDMSLVGPRPERPHFVQQLADAIPFYQHRCYVRPGLTGWAQVNFPYGASIEDAREKLAYDLYYVKHRSLLLDLIVVLSTIRVVLFREGAR